jgi:hypothetical protein
LATVPTTQPDSSAGNAMRNAEFIPGESQNEA